ncbi:MAG TPA: CvpA family protein [Candidatus Wallbacteria bacterium]|nr:CvpA family protein [Candidatus Wallbacteria bacterium]
MNPKLIDAMFLSYLVFSVAWGYFVGGVSELFSLAGLFIVCAISMKTFNYVAVILIKNFGMANIPAYIAAFFIVFMAVYIVLKISKTMLEKKIEGSKFMTSANKNLGMAVGFVKGVIICLVIGLTILLMPFGKETKENLSGSIFLAASKIFEPAVMNMFADKNLFEAAAKMNSNPKGTSDKLIQSKEFQKIISHPKIQSIAEDQDIKKAVEKNDFMALMSNKKFLEMMNDPEVMDLIRTIDLQKVLSESTKKNDDKSQPPGSDLPGLMQQLQKQYQSQGKNASETVPAPR